MKIQTLLAMGLLVFASTTSFANDDLAAVMKNLSQANKDLTAAIDASDVPGASQAAATAEGASLAAYVLEPDTIAKLEDPVDRAKKRVAYKKLMLKLGNAFLEEQELLLDNDLANAKLKLKEISDLRKQGHGAFIQH